MSNRAIQQVTPTKTSSTTEVRLQRQTVNNEEKKPIPTLDLSPAAKANAVEAAAQNQNGDGSGGGGSNFTQLLPMQTYAIPSSSPGLIGSLNHRQIAAIAVTQELASRTAGYDPALVGKDVLQAILDEIGQQAVGKSRSASAIASFATGLIGQSLLSKDNSPLSSDAIAGGFKSGGLGAGLSLVIPGPANETWQVKFSLAPDFNDPKKSFGAVGISINLDAFSGGSSRKPTVVQPKLTVNTPGDKYEQEADRVAEQVMRMPEPQVQRQCACGKNSIDGECSECKKKKQPSTGSLQRVASSPAGGVAAPPIVDSVLSSPGSQLPDSTRNFMESRFGHDFSHVRVHTDQRATESAAAVKARAYTVGNNIVFGRGESPSRDQHLLAHELTHTLQQGNAGESATVRRQQASEEPLKAPGELKEHQKNKHGGQHVFEYKEGSKTTWIDPYKIDFLQSAGFDVYQAARKKGFSAFGSLFVVAHASLESDWGKGNWSNETHNLFSIMGGSNKKYSNAHGTLSKFSTNEEGFEAYVALLGKSDRWPTTVAENTGLLRLDYFTADDLNKALHQKPYYSKGGPAYNADPDSDYGQDLLNRMKFLIGPLLAALDAMGNPPTPEPVGSAMVAHFKELLTARTLLLAGKKTPASTGASTVSPISGDVKRKAFSSSGGMEAPSIVNEVVSSSGAPLPVNTRTFMESRFDQDFSHVRVHTDQQAADSAASVQARAYTVGNHIVFGQEQFEPTSTSGQRLLAHELTHVRQQSRSDEIRSSTTFPSESTGRHVQRFLNGCSPQSKTNVPIAFAPNDPIWKIESGWMVKILEQLQAYFASDINTFTGIETGVASAQGINNKRLEIAVRAVLSKNGKSTTRDDEVSFLPLQQRLEIFEFIGNKALTSLGESKNKRTVKAYYFPGKSSEKALVVGGIHGSELSAIEVAELLLQDLQQSTEKPYFSVVLVPVLFPDNREVTEQEWQKSQPDKGIGRYTLGQPEEKRYDPNRKYPQAGTAYDPNNPIGASGVPMEPENVMLLELINAFQPTRIAALHSIQDSRFAGFYADPRTDSSQVAKGYTQDEALALRISNRALAEGAEVPGNSEIGREAINKSSKKKMSAASVKHTALYPRDPPIAEKGKPQDRDTEGNTSSFGAWSSTDVKGGRPAMTTITMEVDTGRPSHKPGDSNTNADRLKDLKARSIALREVFLGPRQPNDPP